MLMSSKQARLETYEVKIESTINEFSMTTRCTKVDKSELLFLENPNYENIIQSYPHLKGVTIEDRDKKPKLPVHVVLGNGDYSRILIMKQSIIYKLQARFLRSFKTTYRRGRMHCAA